MQISSDTERRFVLGLQGLWPGRRWRGPEGVRSAVSACRRIQVDPLDVIGQNHDLVLASRVAGYRSEYLDDLLYKDRAAFEFGGGLSIFPREILRLQWSWVQNWGLPIRWEKWGREHAATTRRVLADIDRLGPREAADWSDGKRTENYRASTVEGLALYFLWRRLDLLVHHRTGNRKFYDRTERILGPLPAPLPKEETRDQMALETLSWLGLSGAYGVSYLRTNEDGRGRSRVTKRQIRQRLVDDGRLVEVRIEGERQPAVLRAEALPLLEEVAAGNVPSSWRPLSDEPEAVFLAPLDIVAARERAWALFDFEYLFEVYKPASKRRWGYYVLPVLLGDRLVGRIEPVRDRTSGSVHITRAWWEHGVHPVDLVEPLARGLKRMAAYLGSTDVTLGRVGSAAFRSSLAREIREQSA